MKRKDSLETRTFYREIYFLKFTEQPKTQGIIFLKNVACFEGMYLFELIFMLFWIN